MPWHPLSTRFARGGSSRLAHVAPQMWADVKGALGVGGALSWFPSLASLLLILLGLSAVC